jgi:hypothetical protein
MNTIREKTQELKTSILRFGASARAVIREVCTFEFLGLTTMLLPALMAGIGFFFGKTVTPVYFYVAVAILTCAAFLVGWRRGLAYLALLAVCAALTMYTFSYVGTDVESYHFPMQYLLHHGWNPVFDSTIEKFDIVAGGAQMHSCHVLFLPKFTELCGAIVASALRLFVGDGFLGYVLIACLFSACVKFGRRFWSANVLLCVAFACGVISSNRLIHLPDGYAADYSTYATFCISSLSLVLYARDRKLSDLATFFVSTCICMTSKTTGVLCSGLLVIMTIPLLWRRSEYWRTLFGIGVVVAVVGASPLLTNWIQYGSPFYPSMTFDPNVATINITSEFTENADAHSMGYLSRICYAWVSPRLAIAAVRLLRGNPDFNPVFGVYGGVAGIGPTFNVLLLTSIVLLFVSRKNLVTWLCVVIFVSANFAPLKFIGYNRYFPQIWAIFPLAVMNFVCTSRTNDVARRQAGVVRRIVSILLVVILSVMSFKSFVRVLGYQCKVMADERMLQDALAATPNETPIFVSGEDYRFTTVLRLRQAGLSVEKRAGAKLDPRLEALTVEGTEVLCREPYPIYKFRQLRSYSVRKRIRELVEKEQWLSFLDLMPHVLWDDNAKWNCNAKGVAK